MTRRHERQVHRDVKPESAGPKADWQRRTTFGPHTGLSNTLPAPAPSPGGKKISSGGGGTHPNETPGNSVRAISGSGSGTVATTYTPEPTDQSTKIVFIQVMSESLDGQLVKPSVADASFNYQDADTTSDFHHVDYVSGEKDPYYNGDDAKDFGPQGNALTKVPASTTDTPSYDDSAFPPGKSKLLWDFRTAAFSADGADAGRYYAYSDWAYQKDKGIAGKTTTKGTSFGPPGAKFESAVKLFNSNHGFKMPGSGGLLGGILGAAVFGAAGAIIGSAFGGAGAVIGGLAGAGAGAFLGSRKNEALPSAGRAK
jgi:hypothetical protein